MQFNRHALAGEQKETVSCHTQDKTDEFNVIPGHNYRIILTKGEPMLALDFVFEQNINWPIIYQNRSFSASDKILFNINIQTRDSVQWQGHC